MVLWISALVFAAGLGVSLRARAEARRRRDMVARRRVEEPNSHYSAPEVRRLEALERWQAIPLDQLHPVNRDEACRLLATVRRTGPDALSHRERRLLDTLMLQGRAVQPLPQTKAPAAPGS